MSAGLSGWRAGYVAGPLLLAAATTQWVAPILFYFTWFGLSISNPPPLMEVASFCFFALVPTTTWLSHVIFRADDQAHREMHVAAIGSLWRVTLVRSLAGVVSGVVLGFASLLLAALASQQAANLGWALLTLLAAALVGGAIALPFSPPVVEARGLAFGTGLAGLVFLLLFPGTQWALLRAGRNEPVGSIAALAGSLALATVALVLAFTLQRRYAD